MKDWKDIFRKKETQRTGVVEAEKSEKKEKSRFMSLFALMICLIGSYAVCLHFIGNGFYTYSDELYSQLETVEKAAVGLGMISEESEVTSEEIAEAKENAEAKAENAVDLSKLNIQVLKEGTDHYEISGDRANFKMTCYIKNGVFKAESTLHVSEGKFTGITKNYDSQAEYMSEFQVWFGVFVFGGGIVVYLLIFEGLVWLISKGVDLFENIKEKKANKAAATTV